MASHNNAPNLYPANTIVFVNSADKYDHETHENFSLEIETLLGSQIGAVSVQEVIMPASWYRINSTNNTFALGISAGTSTVTITPGNYTTTNFTGSLGELTLDLNTVTPGITWTTTYSSTSGLLTITNSTNTPFSITTNAFNNSYLGMDVNSTVSSSAGVWTSPGVLDLSGSRFIEIRSTMNLNTTSTISYNQDILARLPTNVTPYGIIVYTTESFSFLNSRVNFINKVGFSLYDDRGNPISLNGQSWQIALLFHSL